jgi:hypothetical protein
VAGLKPRVPPANACFVRDRRIVREEHHYLIGFYEEVLHKALCQRIVDYYCTRYPGLIQIVAVRAEASLPTRVGLKISGAR